MSDSTHGPCRRASAPPPLGAAGLAVGLALLVAACGGSKAPQGSANGAVAYSRCMRSHGVSNFPDPTSSGQVDKTRVIPLEHSPQFHVAERACQQLLPDQYSQSGPTQAQVQAALSGMVRFAVCMRSHGAGNWPDPYVDRSRPGDPRPVFDLHSSINPDAPAIRADTLACQHVMPGSTSPYMCSTAAAPPGSGPGDEGCGGGSAAVP